MVLFSGSAAAQIVGNLVSIYPNSELQGQTLITTITAPSVQFTISSAPCDNYGIRLVQGAYIIYSNSYNLTFGNDYLDAEFTIPGAAPTGWYDVYVESGYYDWNGCVSLGDWVLYSGFEVTGTTLVRESTTSATATVDPNPFSGQGLLSFNNPERKKYRLTVLDSFGRKVQQQETGEQQIELSRNTYNPGIYFYRLEGMENKFYCMGKFVVVE